MAARRKRRKLSDLFRRGHPQHAPLREQRAQRRRLDRLVQNLDAFDARSSRTAGVRSAVIRIAGRSPQPPAQRDDGLDAVAMVEMIVD